MIRPSKKLNEQTIVITGASSGIGLATAILAASQGAKVVLCARSAWTLGRIVERIIGAGGDAVAVRADVSVRDELETVAKTAFGRFGHIDTWINNAGVSMFSRLTDASAADAHRLFDTNFWGVVNGSMVAVPYLEAQGGTIINVGSGLDPADALLQGMCSASKQAVKSFTDTLRTEMGMLELPISVSLIEPAATDTPYRQHARNCLKRPIPEHDEGVAPEMVALAILEAAVSPVAVKRVTAGAPVPSRIAKLVASMAVDLGLEALNDAPDEAGTLFMPSDHTQLAGRVRAMRRMNS